MPFLSPAKLLVILVMALVVLGPDKLPKVAKQIGGLWGDVRAFRQKLEAEVRGSLPDLPSTDTMARAMRSPLSLLDDLAATPVAEPGTAPAPADGSGPPVVGGDEGGPPSGSDRPTGGGRGPRNGAVGARGAGPGAGR